MREDFDPYYVWLGIPPREQPPDHYRLLGIAQFEADADVIRHATEQRMSYLRTVTGPRAKQAQRLITEIVAAQRILAEDASREKYNALITESPLAKSRSVPPPAVSTPAFEPPAIDTPSYQRRTRHARNSEGDDPRRLQTRIIILGAVAIATVVLVVSITVNRRAEKMERGRAAELVSKEKPAKAKRKAQAEAERQAKSKADRKEKAEAEREAKAEAERQAKAKAERNAKKEAAREAEVADREETAENLSSIEKAEDLLASRGLEEGFNSEWELTGLTAAYEEAINLSGSSSRVDDAIFEAELKRRVDAKKKEILARWKWVMQQPAGHPQLDAEYHHLMISIAYPNNPEAIYVRDDIPEITSIRSQLEAEYASKPWSSNEAMIQIAKQMRDKHRQLSTDATVQAALKTVGGTLAEPPEFAEAIKQKATSRSLSRPNDREAAKEKKTRGDSNSKAVTSQTTEELYKTALEEMLRPYSLAQRKLLRTAMTKYRKATEIEWNKLLKAGQQLAGQTAAIAFRHHGTNEYGQVGFARFNFLAAHHPDVDTSYLGFSKKSIQPFLLEALESSLQILQNKRAWKNASKQRSKSSERLPKPIYEFNRVLSLGGTNNTRNAFTSNIGQPPFISAEVVVRVNSSREWGSITGQALDNGSTEQGWQLGYNRHVFQWRLGTVGGRFSQAESKTGLQEKKVHHVVGTYNGQSMKLYVDGVLQSTKPNRGRINYPASPFIIGGHADNNEYLEMNGVIYLVRVYAAALSDAQVKSRYNEVRHKIDGLNEGG